MKKILFLFLYLGNEDATSEEIAFRTSHCLMEIQYLTKLTDKYNVFDKKYLVAVAPSSCDSFIESVCSNYGLALYRNNIERDNTYEYPAFMAMSRESKITPDSAFFYAHCKGTGNPTNVSFGIFKLHTSQLLCLNVDRIFSDGKINTIGLFPSQHAALWHNFFWVKTNYFKDKPILKWDNRFEFEHAVDDRSDPEHYKTSYSPLRYMDHGTDFKVMDWYTSDDIDIQPTFYDLFHLSPEL
jgi:hypothetical protein